MKIKVGFTLAEILITITVLGVIAAITLPAIKSQIDKTTLEKQTQKMYSSLVNAVSQYKAEEGLDSLDDSFATDSNIKKYFSISETFTDAEKAFSDSYLNINSKSEHKLSSVLSLAKTIDNEDEDGDNGEENNSQEPEENPETKISFDTFYKLPDGTIFSIKNNQNRYIVIFDVNGKKGPNTIGQDYWVVSIYENGLVDEPDLNLNDTPDNITSSVKTAFDACLSTSTYGCFGHFLRNKFKFDY